LTVDMIHVITHALSATFDSGHDTDVIMHALSATFNSDLSTLKCQHDSANIICFVV